MDEELTEDQKELQKQLLGEFMSDQLFPAPHHFAARAEIYRLRALVEQLEKDAARSKKGSTEAGESADKPKRVKNGGEK